MQEELHHVQEIIEQCKVRNERAELHMYKYLYPKLIGICRRYSKQKEEALDYFNAGFVRIMLNLKQYKTSVPFEFWSRRVMINTIINEYKKNRRWYDRHVLSEDHFLHGVVEKGLTDYQSDLLEQVIEKAKLLPPMTRKVFNRYAIDGYHHYEIADQLGISEGTSAWHYSDAKKKMKNWLGIEQ
ncbi:MAG: RNA polymerase sigma factor [Flavobacteriales bacterium]